MSAALEGVRSETGGAFHLLQVHARRCFTRLAGVLAFSLAGSVQRHSDRLCDGVEGGSTCWRMRALRTTGPGGAVASIDFIHGSALHATPDF